MRPDSRPCASNVPTTNGEARYIVEAPAGRVGSSGLAGVLTNPMSQPIPLARCPSDSVRIVGRMSETESSREVSSVGSSATSGIFQTLKGSFSRPAGKAQEKNLAEQLLEVW